MESATSGHAWAMWALTRVLVDEALATLGDAAAEAPVRVGARMTPDGTKHLPPLLGFHRSADDPHPAMVGLVTNTARVGITRVWLHGRPRP
jgi:hypothetical protein